MSGFSSEMAILVLALSESENQPHQWIDRPDEVWQQIRESDYVKTLWEYIKLCERGYNEGDIPEEIIAVQTRLHDIEQELDQVLLHYGDQSS